MERSESEPVRDPKQRVQPDNSLRRGSLLRIWSTILMKLSHS
jgi:hypothetical protein